MCMLPKTSPTCWNANAENATVQQDAMQTDCPVKRELHVDLVSFKLKQESENNFLIYCYTLVGKNDFIMSGITAE